MKLELTPLDHITVAIHAFFILIGLKLALSNHIPVSMFGGVLAYLNLKSFDVYSLWRKHARTRQ